MTQVDDSTVEINPTPNQDDIFVCPEDFRSAFFKIHNGLQKHVGNGKHFIIQKDKTSSVDTIKKIWVDTFGVSKSESHFNYSQSRTLKKNLFSLDCVEIPSTYPRDKCYEMKFCQGWALKSTNTFSGGVLSVWHEEWTSYAPARC